MRHMTARELQAYLEQAEEKPLLLDVREPWEFQHCHIEGSELIPMGQIPAAFPELDFDRETVVICHHGIRSRHVALYLENMGFTNLINLSGGVAAWAREVDPHMPTY
jgi:rhodanese-related sulfurtransferase